MQQLHKNPVSDHHVPASGTCETMEEDIPICSTRSCRKFKAHDMVDLSQCLCGDTVSSAQIDACVDVAQCKKAGCETGWVSADISQSCWTYILSTWL